MSWQDRLRTHPVVTRIVAVGGFVVLVIGAAQAIEASWGLFSSDPLIPAIGGWLRSWSDELMQGLLIVGSIAVTAWAAYILYQIFVSVRVVEMEDELPPNTTWADGWLSAGSDITLDIPMDQAKTAKSVTFTARQGQRLLVREKPGEVDQQRGVFRLPFNGEEARQVKDGYVLLDAMIITGEGNRLRSSRMAIRTYGPV